MKKWIKRTFFKLFKNAAYELMREILDKVVNEVNGEIDRAVKSEEDRTTLKSGMAMLRSRLASEIRDRF